jgi:hypothetical protein
MVPEVEIVRPAGRPVAEKVYGPPTPPLPTMVTGVMATPCLPVLHAHLVVTGGGALTVIEHFTVPECPVASVTVTV